MLHKNLENLNFSGVSSLTKETIRVNNSQSAATQQSTNRNAGFHSEEWACVIMYYFKNFENVAHVSSLTKETINVNSSQGASSGQSINGSTGFGEDFENVAHVSSLTKETININSSQSTATHQSTNGTTDLAKNLENLNLSGLSYVFMHKIHFKMNTNNVEETDRLVKGKNVLKFDIDSLFDRFIVLVYNHMKDKENEQYCNIILIGNINNNNNEIVIPDTVDTQYQLIIIRSYSYPSNLLNLDAIPICIELLNKSQSYRFNIAKCQFKHNLSYFKQSIIINNKQYHSISRFTNSNHINQVDLVCGTDQRLLKIVKLTQPIQNKDNRNYERALNEINAMKLLKGNPRFVQLFDFLDDKDNHIFHLVTEYCHGGDLAQEYKRLTDLNTIFRESDIRKYILQLFEILLDLDKLGIVHCDIKPSNVFFGGDQDDLTLMLGDFGYCKFIGESTIIEYPDTNEHILEGDSILNLKCIDHEITDPSIINSILYATRGAQGYIPEKMNIIQYAQSCDIFSIGSTILKLLCCHQDDRNNHQLLQTKGEIKISEFRYSKQLIDLIHRLLDLSPKNIESLNLLLNQYLETITNIQSASTQQSSNETAGFRPEMTFKVEIMHNFVIITKF
ncbi:hypothetical protein PPL_10432 [Heterostelium album PN500]|uniref:Protein kinase domain-containing protein n=1 Tax=Heterostelium pallidum (strain ATCC 26659 / Pp 5 / PN500) TaxID=670386 RepID=D3BR28_HETP5|nr:hypothetical protein PPL_10432 [Heterostelium album PN500]EFA75860.1 hypothetical protein PPL_10432 [Heterostelium album PN500]|eukprot:XP_020427994.1 hypothetical protein PPL_10432 [Heterostelium album PN500]